MIDATEARDAESLSAQIGSFDRRIMAVLLARRPSFFKMYDTLSVSTESVIPKTSSVSTESVIPQWVTLLINISQIATDFPIRAVLGKAFADLPKARHSELTSGLVAWLNIDAADAFTASLLKAFPTSFFYCMNNFGSERTKIKNLQFYWKTQFDKIIYKASANIELFLIDLIVSGIILCACFIVGVIFYQHAFSGAYNQSVGFHGYTFVLPPLLGLPVWANAFLCVVGLLSGLLLILFLLKCHISGVCNTRDTRLTTFLPIFGSLVSGPLWLVIALSRSVWKDPSLSWLCIGCGWSYVLFFDDFVSNG